MYTKPTVAEFKAYFYRDFVYAPEAVPPATQDPTLGITDFDIEKAMSEADVFFNAALFMDQNSFFRGYLLMTAHFLVMDIRAGMSGMEGNYSWAVQSRSVGSVSESYAIPQSVQNNPALLMFSKTNYGAKYLMFVLPFMVGPILSVPGRTLP